MGTGTGRSGGVGRLAGAALDAVMSGIGISVVVLVPLSILSFAAGTNWYGVKVGLFFGGMLLMGASVWLLRPDKPWEQDDESDDTGPPESVGADIGHFEATVHALPPLSWVDIPPGSRASSGLRLLVASVVLFALSFVMETVFAVCAPGVAC